MGLHLRHVRTAILGDGDVESRAIRHAGADVSLHAGVGKRNLDALDTQMSYLPWAHIAGLTALLVGIVLIWAVVGSDRWRATRNKRLNERHDDFH